MEGQIGPLLYPSPLASHPLTLTLYISIPLYPPHTSLFSETPHPSTLPHSPFTPFPTSHTPRLDPELFPGSGFGFICFGSNPGKNEKTKTNNQTFTYFFINCTENSVECSVKSKSSWLILLFV